MQWAILLAISFSASLVLTPLLARVAQAVGLVDAPDNHRKLHGRVIPLGGGVAVLLAVFIAALASVAMFPNLLEGVFLQWETVASVSLGALLICVVGLADDMTGIRGRQKLLGQLIACLIVVLGGTTIQKFELFGLTWDLGIFAVPVTCLWLLAVINAMNLIDGADGLASTVGVVVSLSFSIMAHLMGHDVEAMFAMMIAGSLAGFLVYNRPPAAIFLGDAGSMLLGLLLGVLAIRSSIKGPATVALGAATAIWAVLFFDVLMAIARRKLTGRSLYTVDRGHVHHMLQHHGFSPLLTILVIGTACGFCALGALLSVALKSELWAFLSVGSVILVFIGSRLFGYHETVLCLRRIKALVLSMFRGVPVGPEKTVSKGNAICSRFQGNRDWEQLWQSLINYAERFDLNRVQMNISSPFISEEYHAVWHNKVRNDDMNSWEMEVPMFVHSRRIGSLAMSGKSIAGESNFHWLADLIEGLRAFETQLDEVLQLDLEQKVTSPITEAIGPVETANELEVVLEEQSDLA